MNDHIDGDGGSFGPNGTASDNSRPHNSQASANHAHPAHSEGHATAPRIDYWVVLDLLAHRWHWPVIGAMLGAAAFFLLGSHRIQPKFTANATLLRYTTPGGPKEFFQPELLSGETIAEMIRSPELLQETCSQALSSGLPPLTPDKFIHCLKIDPASDSDAITLSFVARDAQAAVDYLNLYASNAVAYTGQMQARQARTVANDYLKFQVEQMDSDINALREKLRHLPAFGSVTNKLAEIKLAEVGTNLSALNQNLSGSASSPLIAEETARLNKALGELDDLMLTYKEAYPSVQLKEREINALKQQIARETNNSVQPSAVRAPIVAATPATPAPAVPTVNPDEAIIQISLHSLEDGRVRVETREREAESYAKNPPGVISVHAPANLASIKSNMRRVKVGLATIFGGLIGFGGSMGLVLLVELVDNRLKTVDDLKRVTKLPVIGTLDNLDRLDAEARSQWAFRTWVMLQGRLSLSPNHGLVCGITSSNQGEGRSTWVQLLAEAASLAGFRVLTIATRPSASNEGSGDDSFEEALLEDSESVAPNNRSVALANTVLSSPSKVTERLTSADCRPVVHIPLPGWVWNLDRRKQWRDALNHWRSIENLVILVELPPASVAEAVLLASNLPNLLWLTQSGKAGAAETRAHLATLRHARCNLVGAVLNREPAVPVRQRFPRWLD